MTIHKLNFTVVNIRTTSHIQKLYVLPTQFVYVVRDLKSTTIISLGSMKQWDFVMETRCVCCEVGTELLCTAYSIGQCSVLVCSDRHYYYWPLFQISLNKTPT